MTKKSSLMSWLRFLGWLWQLNLPRWPDCYQTDQDGFKLYLTELSAIIKLIIITKMNWSLWLNLPNFPQTINLISIIPKTHPSTTKSSNKLIRKFTSHARHKFLQKSLPEFQSELMLRLNYKSSVSLSFKWEYDEILSKLIAHFKCNTIVCLIVYSNNIIYRKYASLTLQD